MPDVTILAQPLDETWQALGPDLGVWPENVQLTSDQWGPAQCTFDLKRAPETPWPRLGAFTPVDVHVDGLHVFGGRVKETPVRDGTDSAMSVVCEGWQFHLDDDMYRGIYVHENLTDWVDIRSLPDANLALSRTAPGVETGNGVIRLAFPQGVVIGTSTRVGVALDISAWETVRSIAVDWDSSNNASSISLWATATGFGDPGAADAVDTLGVALDSAAGARTTTQGDFGANLYRSRILLYLLWTAGGTPSADIWLRIHNIRIFADGTYNGGGSTAPSILRAHHVINDALDRATQNLSTDRTGIEQTSFDIPSLAFTDPRTPRQVGDAANAWHNYLTAVDPAGRMLFSPQPSYPELEVGAWSGADFQDASANSGEDIYDRVLVTGQSPAGTQYVVDRYAGMVDALEPIRTTTATSASVTNSSFATDTTGWAVSSKVTGWGITITRDTGTYDTSPASLQISASGASPGSYSIPGPAMVTGDLSGTFDRGVTYKITARIRNNNAGNGLRPWMWAGNTLGDYYDAGDISAMVRAPYGGTTWQTVSVYWTPRYTYNASTDANVMVMFATASLSTHSFHVDSLTVQEVQAGTIQRRGFHRTMNLQISTPLPDDGIAAAQLGDTWLAAHATVPFRGTVTLGGDALRGITTGETVSLARLLTMPRALLRFSDRGDPDSGAHGRDGRIASVSYDPQQDQASVAIDNTRANFDALLARLAVVSGG